MMGQGSGGHRQLFYSFNLDDHVPADHLLRGIDRFLNLGELRRHLAPFYSDTGRPSIAPELMVRMLIVGYSFGIRSERRLCDEVHLNLAYRWFCRLGLEDTVPDHSTFSKNRHGRFRESDAFRHLFESVVERCMKEGLVGGEGFAIDASVIKADANRSRSTAREEAEGLRDPQHASRAVREYLAALDAQAEPATAPASISPTDPAARWTAVDGPAFYAYATNYLIDVQAGIIVDVEATPAWRTAEINATRTMIERVEQRFDLKPERLIGDSAYGAAELLGWMVNEKAIEPHVPVCDKTQRSDETLSRSEYAAACRKEANKILGAVADKARLAGVPFSQAQAISAAPWEAILAAAKKNKCDAVVMASHGRRGVTALLLGSETQKVLTHSKLPVIVVR